MTDNVLDTNYLEELSEFFVAYVKAVKEQFGVTLYALSIQNELEFNEFYNSCHYTPAKYMRAVQVVGKRFAQEGLTTKLYGPENLPAQGDYLNYINAITILLHEIISAFMPSIIMIRLEHNREI